MIIVAEMKNGGTFEAESRKKLIQKMVEYFSQNDSEASQIKALYIVFKDNSIDELCSEAVKKTQNAIDEQISEWRRIADEEYRGQQEIEQEFYGCLL